MEDKEVVLENKSGITHSAELASVEEKRVRKRQLKCMKQVFLIH